MLPQKYRYYFRTNKHSQKRFNERFLLIFNAPTRCRPPYFSIFVSHIMEELEDPTERLKETLEAAEEQKERWTLYVALSTAIIAVLAAIAGMLGNHHANEAMLEQIKASDKWAYYQAKSIKSEMASNTSLLLTSLDKPVSADYTQKIAKYEKDKADIKSQAEELEKASEEHMHTHIVFSRAVTIFQVAIAISAIAIVTRRRFMWYLSMLLAVIGSVFLLLGFFTH